MNIAIFGTHDSLAGQVYSMVIQLGYHPVCFIGDVLIDIDLEHEHNVRPNRKMEFAIHNKFYNLPVEASEIFFRGECPLRIDAVVIAEYGGVKRQRIFKSLEMLGIRPLTLIHPSAHLAGQNDIGEGTVILPNTYVGYKTDIGKSCIVQSMSCIEHHSKIGDFCDINPTVGIAGSVYVGNYCEINMGVTIINRIRVSEGCRIGAGSLVLADCSNPGLYYGRPAKLMKTFLLPDV